uniref:Calcineurin-like phosphoesterase domain-containing protein n=1 Tax=Parascaris equorum TaxID=6256 RepID=A0A914R5Y8_PAREQ
MGEEEQNEFQISVGDNVYYTGVKDVFDSRFKSTFETVYQGEALQKPWYFIAGNHDHFGNITAQVAYTNHSSRWSIISVSYPSILFATSLPNSPKTSFVFNRQLTRYLGIPFRGLKGLSALKMNHMLYEMKAHSIWMRFTVMTFPSLYYKISYKFGEKGIKVDFIMIDTIVLCGNTRDVEDSSFFEIAEYVFVAGHYPDFEVIVLPDVDCSLVLPPDPTYPTGFNPLSQLGFSNGGFVFVEVSDQSATFKFFTASFALFFEHLCTHCSCAYHHFVLEISTLFQ